MHKKETDSYNHFTQPQHVGVAVWVTSDRNSSHNFSLNTLWHVHREAKTVSKKTFQYYNQHMWIQMKLILWYVCLRLLASNKFLVIASNKNQPQMWKNTNYTGFNSTKPLQTIIATVSVLTNRTCFSLPARGTLTEKPVHQIKAFTFVHAWHTSTLVNICWSNIG